MAKSRAVLTLRENQPIGELVILTGPESPGRSTLRLAASMAEVWDLPLRLVQLTEASTSLDPELKSLLLGMRPEYSRLRIVFQQLVTGDPVDALRQHLRSHSLPVLSGGNELADESRLEKALLAHPDIALFVRGPSDGTADPLGEVLVGLDGSAEAERALRPAQGLAAAMDQPVCLVGMAGLAADRGLTTEGQLDDYLQRLAHRLTEASGSRGSTVPHDGLGRDLVVHWAVLPGAVLPGGEGHASIESFVAGRKAGFVVAVEALSSAIPRHLPAMMVGAVGSVASDRVSLVR